MISFILCVAALVFFALLVMGVMPSAGLWSMLCIGLAIAWPIIRTKIVIALYKKKYGYKNDQDALKHFIHDINTKNKPQ